MPGKVPTEVPTREEVEEKLADPETGRGAGNLEAGFGQTAGQGGQASASQPQNDDRPAEIADDDAPSQAERHFDGRG